MRILILYLIPIVNAFYTNLKWKQSTKIYSEDPPSQWQFVSSIFKNKARNWFIQRAEKKGIAWREMSQYYQDNQKTLDNMKYKKENKEIIYPLYYTQPFHGYDTGNLNWKAAHEVEAASLSISSTYYEGIDPITSQDYMRFNFTKHIRKYAEENHIQNYISTILDAGSSTGVSTEFLYRSFPDSQMIHGMELSPYFISVAEMNRKRKKYPLHYIHGNIQSIPFKDESISLIVCSFVFHEVPSEVITDILREFYRVLRPNGIIAVMDLDPDNLQRNLILNQFRKWAFEVTEPHIYKYYDYNLLFQIEDTGFSQVKKVKNDPLNSIWLGIKKNNK